MAVAACSFLASMAYSTAFDTLQICISSDATVFNMLDQALTPLGRCLDEQCDQNSIQAGARHPFCWTVYRQIWYDPGGIDQPDLLVCQHQYPSPTN